MATGKIPPKVVARCLGWRNIWKVFDISSAIVAEPIDVIHWGGTAKFAEYIILTKLTTAASSCSIGYAANGGGRSALDVDAFVTAANFLVPLSGKIGSNYELTITDDQINSGDVITFTSDGAAGAGKILVKLWYESATSCSNDIQTFGSTSSTSTTTTTTTTGA